MRTLVWRGLDAPRMEIAHVDSLDPVGVSDGEEREVELGDCDFFDLGYSPFFNSLPVVRDGVTPYQDFLERVG